MHDILEERAEALKKAIKSAENAHLELVTGAVQSYTLNTGQTTQSVTKSNISTLLKHIDGLYNALATVETRLKGSGTVVARGAW